ncbi:MAG: ATP-dependent zinc metalloprotease FtsH [Firmicutes bacterium]|nr:ATP-dependent zinc metalloprotease FtsH [Bacillota bacterium]
MEEIKTPKRPIIYYLLIVIVSMLVLNLLVMPRLMNRQFEEATYSEFLEMIEEGHVTEVEVQEQQILFTDDSDPMRYYKTGLMNDPDLISRLEKAGVTFTATIEEEASPWMTLLVGYVVPLLIFMVVGRLLMNSLMKRMGGEGIGGNMMTFGKSNAKIYVQSTDGIRFTDVAGEDEAKELLTEIVDYLHNPGRYADIGATIPKGALLVGPPGTGKTLLAKAVAGEANVPFFSISGSDFVEMFVGMGAAKVRDLFKQANEKAPCIIFIDEIDTIGKKRDGLSGIGGNDEREQTLNQLLSEMDGFNASKGVIILGATNRPDSLDPALLRPGRFDRRIPVELPDLQGRVDILKVHAKKVKMGDNVDFDAIARMAVGASGAELANMINEAALRAVRAGRRFVTQADLEESVEVVIAGYQKKNAILSDKEKRIVAYHEIGHALVAALQSHSAPVTKITIIPRTSGALGYTMQVDEDEHNLMSKEEIENKIATLTGGRIAEDLIFHSITTGASNDIEQATKLARAMVTRFGMTEEFGMVALETISNQYLGGDASLACSPDTSTAIDQKVIEVVRTQYEKAEGLLKSHMKELNGLANYLYDHETITGEEFMGLLEQMKVPETPVPSESSSEREDSASPAAEAIENAGNIGKQETTAAETDIQTPNAANEQESTESIAP